MKTKLFLSTLFFLFIVIVSLAQTNIWNQKTNTIAGERREAASFSIGNKGYVGTGFRFLDGNGAYLSDFWEYDPACETWTQKADFLGGPRNRAVGFSIGNLGYIGGGNKNDFYEYNPGGNFWRKKADIGGSPVRQYAVGFSIGSKGYVGLGIGLGSMELKDFWEFDPSTPLGIWTPKADFCCTRYLAVGVSLDGRGYVGTGTGANFPMASDFYEFNPNNGPLGSWTAMNPIPAIGGRHGAIAFTINHRIYVGFGENTQDFWEFNPTAGPLGTWRSRATLTNGSVHEYSFAFSILGKGYMGCGLSGGNPMIPDFWEYIPDDYTDFSNTWDKKQNDFMGGKRFGAVGLSNGLRGYVGTGIDITSTFKNDFWEYNPSTDVWTQKANVGLPNSSNTERTYAVGFNIGNLCYIGTGFKSGTILNDFWEYNPRSNEWTQKTNIPVGRYGAVGFGTGKRGYVGTGNGSSGLRSDFYEFNPSGSGSWILRAPFTEGRVFAVGFSIGKFGYVGTGINNLASSNTTKDFWQFNTKTLTWNRKTDLPGVGVERYSAYGFSICSKGYIGSGSHTASNFFQDCFEYDPGLNTWTPVANFAPARIFSAYFSIGNHGYVLTGQDINKNLLDDVWEYTPGNLCQCPASPMLALNLFLEGFYAGNGLMNNCLYATGESADPSDADFVNVSIMDANSPYDLVESQAGLLKTDGSVSVTFSPAVSTSSSYFIKINQRNHTEMWSAEPVVFDSITTYSFSTAPLQAFGANEAELRTNGMFDGKFGLYCGDINQDFSVDASDFLILDPSISLGDGGYLDTDLNGDGSVDATDFLYLDANIQMGIGCSTP